VFKEMPARLRDQQQQLRTEQENPWRK
jgi:hypothetical protein